MLQYRSLLIRGNRALGSMLVDRNLISVEVLSQANEKFSEVLGGENLKQASVLNILLYELKVLNEIDLINSQVEGENFGLIDLGGYDLEKGAPADVDPGLCWATWTIPFDKVDNFYFMASSYALSAPVVQHWKNLLGGELIWYVSPVASLTVALERLEAARQKKAEPAAAAPAKK